MAEPQTRDGYTDSVLEFARTAIGNCLADKRTPRRWEFSNDALEQLRHELEGEARWLDPTKQPVTLFGVPIATTADAGRRAFLIVEPRED